MMLSNQNYPTDHQIKAIVNAIKIILQSGFKNPPEDLLVKMTEFSAKTDQKTTLLCLGKTLKNCPMDEDIRLKNWKIFISTWLSTTFNVKYNLNLSVNNRTEVVRNLLSTLFSELKKSSTNITNKSYEVSSIDLLVKSMFYTSTIKVKRHFSMIKLTNILINKIVCGETSGIG